MKAGTRIQRWKGVSEQQEFQDGPPKALMEAEENTSQSETPANISLQRRGGYHALHNRCCFNHLVVAGISQFLHHGGLYSPSSGNSHRGGPASDH
jgi:hypothetical protein